jgi:hypothetical protein
MTKHSNDKTEETSSGIPTSCSNKIHKKQHSTTSTTTTTTPSQAAICTLNNHSSSSRIEKAIKYFKLQTTVTTTTSHVDIVVNGVLLRVETETVTTTNTLSLVPHEELHEQMKQALSCTPQDTSTTTEDNKNNSTTTVVLLPQSILT